MPSKKCLLGELILMLLILPTSSVGAENPTPKTLNNLVKELVNFNFSTSPEEDYLDKPYKVFTFERKKDGWIYIRLGAALNKEEQVWVTLADSFSEKPVVNLANNTDGDKVAETMRFVKAGQYSIRLWSKGRPRFNNVIVRSIPEIIFHKVEFLRKKSYGYDFSRQYSWNYLRENILDSYNIIASDADNRYAPYINEWRKRGGKWLVETGVGWGPTVDDVYKKWGKLMENTLFDGITIGEFGGSPKFVQNYPLWGKTMKKIRSNPVCKDKMLYGYSGISYNLRRKALFDMLFESGYKCAPEAYYEEKPTEKEAEKHLEKYLINVFTKWREGYPGVEENMVICLAPSNVPPRCSWNACPNANFKVFVDKQFYHLANHPAFKNLYGVTFFTAHYMDEEMLRWFTQLVRHYLIEGNKDMLSTDPYILTHLVNPGFEEGQKGWDFSSALRGSIKVIDTDVLEFKKSRDWNAIPEGSKALYTRRSAGKPNIISQKIKNLTQGRLYSLKVYNTDFRNFIEKKRISISIRLKGVELLEDKCRDDVFTYDFPLTKKKGETKVCWNSHYRVFRAKTDSGELILSDWIINDMAGGPPGQEIIWDFIELQPYFPDQNVQ